LYSYELLLLSNKQEYSRAKGEEAHQPRHGRRGRNEGSQTCQQEIDYHTPGGKTFGHVHFDLLLDICIDRVVNFNKYNTDGIYRLRKSNPNILFPCLIILPVCRNELPGLPHHCGPRSVHHNLIIPKADHTQPILAQPLQLVL